MFLSEDHLLSRKPSSQLYKDLVYYSTLKNRLNLDEQFQNPVWPGRWALKQETSSLLTMKELSKDYVTIKFDGSRASYLDFADTFFSVVHNNRVLTILDRTTLLTQACDVGVQNLCCIFPTNEFHAYIVMVEKLF